MSELVEFLRARLDEDERIAREAKPGPWHADGGSVYATHPTDEVVDYTEDSAAHMARHDPARVLADVAAKRRILGDFLAEVDSMDDRIEGEWGAGPPGERVSLELLRALALPYADHHDYKAEWAG